MAPNDAQQSGDLLREIMRLAICFRALRGLLAIVLFFSAICSGHTEELKFSDVVKASLVFRAEHKPSAFYPHLLKIYLRLENVYDGDTSWVANSVSGVRADLLDADGRPITMPHTSASIGSNAGAFLLPYGSNMEWLISHGGVSMVGDIEKMYAIVVGARGWLVPVDSIDSYTLRIQLYGPPLGA